MRETLALARAAETLGYSRYWLAEHHGSSGLAGTAPEVLAAAVAAATSTIRVGAGGVLLSHYSSLKVAEAFRVLHALFPSRIDLGIGRTPGADSVTTAALQAGPDAFGDELFPRRVADLLAFLEGGVEDDHPFAGVRTMPDGPGHPNVWLLGSSPHSAGLAAALGLSFSFAHFITPEYGPQVVARYRRNFRPAAPTDTPIASVAVSVVCAETDAEAERLATSNQTWHLGPEDGRGPVPSVEEARARMAAASGVERARLTQHRSRLVVGGPDRASVELAALAQAFSVDELLVLTICHDPTDRLRSYELLAAACGLERP